MLTYRSVYFHKGDGCVFRGVGEKYVGAGEQQCYFGPCNALKNAHYISLAKQLVHVCVCVRVCTHEHIHTCWQSLATVLDRAANQACLIGDRQKS